MNEQELISNQEPTRRKILSSNSTNGNIRPIHRFPPGVSGNPKGRPKGSKNKFSIAELAQAIKKVERQKQKKFMLAWVEAAWGDPDKMSNIANYMLPKLKSIEGIITSFESSMSDELAKSIQDKLRERYI